MSKKYKKLAEVLAPNGADFLWKNATLDTSELATIVGHPVNLTTLVDEFDGDVETVGNARYYLNKKLSGKKGKNFEPKDVRVASYKADGKWWKTFVPVNGRTPELTRYLERFNQTEKFHIVEEATSWNENYEFKRTTKSANRQNKFAEVNAYFRSKLQGKTVKVKELFTTARERLIGGQK